MLQQSSGPQYSSGTSKVVTSDYSTREDGNDGRQRITPLLPLPLFRKPFTTSHSSIRSELLNRIVDAMATAKTSEDDKQPDQVAGGRDVAPISAAWKDEKIKRKRRQHVSSLIEIRA